MQRVIYGISAFNKGKALNGALCGVLRVDYATGGTIVDGHGQPTNLIENVHIDSTGTPAGSLIPNEYLIGTSTCQYSNPNFVISVDNVTYVFDENGDGVSSNTKAISGDDDHPGLCIRCLSVADESSSVTHVGESINIDTDPLHYIGNEDYQTLTDLIFARNAVRTVKELTARDKFAIQALHSILSKTSYPMNMSPSEIKYYCETAYKWSDYMLLSAASRRMATNDCWHKGDEYKEGPYTNFFVQQELGYTSIAAAEADGWSWEAGKQDDDATHVVVDNSEGGSIEPVEVDFTDVTQALNEIKDMIGEPLSETDYDGYWINGTTQEVLVGSERSISLGSFTVPETGNTYNYSTVGDAIADGWTYHSGLVGGQQPCLNVNVGGLDNSGIESVLSDIESSLSYVSEIDEDLERLNTVHLESSEWSVLAEVLLTNNAFSIPYYSDIYDSKDIKIEAFDVDGWLVSYPSNTWNLQWVNGGTSVGSALTAHSAVEVVEELKNPTPSGLVTALNVTFPQGVGVNSLKVYAKDTIDVTNSIDTSGIEKSIIEACSWEIVEDVNFFINADCNINIPYYSSFKDKEIRLVAFDYNNKALIAGNTIVTYIYKWSDGTGPVDMTTGTQECYAASELASILHSNTSDNNVYLHANCEDDNGDIVTNVKFFRIYIKSDTSGIVNKLNSVINSLGSIANEISSKSTNRTVSFASAASLNANIGNNGLGNTSTNPLYISSKLSGPGSSSSTPLYISGGGGGGSSWPSKSDLNAQTTIDSVMSFNGNAPGYATLATLFNAAYSIGAIEYINMSRFLTFNGSGVASTITKTKVENGIVDITNTILGRLNTALSNAGIVVAEKPNTSRQNLDFVCYRDYTFKDGYYFLKGTVTVDDSNIVNPIVKIDASDVYPTHAGTHILTFDLDTETIVYVPQTANSPYAIVTAAVTALSRIGITRSPNYTYKSPTLTLEDITGCFEK